MQVTGWFGDCVVLMGVVALAGPIGMFVYLVSKPVPTTYDAHVQGACLRFRWIAKMRDISDISCYTMLLDMRY